MGCLAGWSLISCLQRPVLLDFLTMIITPTVGKGFWDTGSRWLAPPSGKVMTFTKHHQTHVPIWALANLNVLPVNLMPTHCR